MRKRRGSFRKRGYSRPIKRGFKKGKRFSNRYRLSRGGIRL